jgi:hypothetical protein
MNNEYEALYAEIKDWQDRRFTVLTAAIGLVTAILGLKIFDQPARIELWPWISALLLLLLSSACILTWYAGRANAKLAAYLICFHERPSPSGDGWQSRLHRLKQSRMDRLNLNRIVVCIYSPLAAVSVILPVMQQPPSPFGWVVLSVAIVIFLCSLLLLVLRTPKDHYVDLWDALPPPKPATPNQSLQPTASCRTAQLSHD